MPFVSRTRATLRSAEFGFLGVWVKTRTHTPRFCGLSCSAGLFVFVTTFARPLRTSWLIVGTRTLPKTKTAESLAGARCSRAKAEERSRELAPRNRFVAPGLGNR